MKNILQELANEKTKLEELLARKIRVLNCARKFIKILDSKDVLTETDELFRDLKKQEVEDMDLEMECIEDKIDGIDKALRESDAEADHNDQKIDTWKEGEKETLEEKAERIKGETAYEEKIQ